MSANNQKGYKMYLEPNSDDPIPSSSWYRYKKLRAEEEVANPLPDIQGNQEYATEMDENLGNAETFVSYSNANRSTEEFVTSICDEGTTVDDNNETFNIIQSLAEDIDIIENEILRSAAAEINGWDDQFLDNIDNDDGFMDTLDDCHHTDEVDEEENLLKNWSTSLQDAIDKKVFDKPINVRVNKTVGEVIFMILKFVLVHSLSLTATTDLFGIINCIFAESFLPNTKYLIDKLFYPKNCMKLYATCSKCGAGIGRFERKDRLLECEVCEAQIDVKDYAYKDFFVMMDVASPISKLIESNSEYYNYIMNKRVYERGIMRDIYDGKRYQEFVNKLNNNDRHSYATVIFNTDGAPLFESSTYSIWPIFLMLNEVPFQVRSKELILAGLWFGKDKPNMNTFLEPFVEHMNELSRKGVDCTINGIKICIKIFTLVCCVDSVARAPVQGFTQFNGSYGCSQCLHPGEWVRSNPTNARSGSIKYPLMSDVPQQRTVRDTVEHMKKAANTKKATFGVKCPSQLINLTHYNIIYGCVVESMHCASGIAKQFATMWFGNKKKAGLFSRANIPQIDEFMINIKAPHQIVRLTRSFSEKEFWKAREWENWIIFYSVPILQNILSHHLLMHWALFVEAFYILTKGEIQNHEIDRADMLLHKFVGQAEILYSKVSMTFNMHLLLHLARSVLDWGPLWSHNAYGFESGNGDLLKVIHAAKGVHHQICRRISLKYSFLSLADYVYPLSTFAVKNYCNTIGTTSAKKTLQINDIRYFGCASKVDVLWLEKFHLREQAISYGKIVKNGCLYMTSVKNSKRSNNSFAQLENNLYVKIHTFIVDCETQLEYTIVQNVSTTNAHNNLCGMLQKIIHITDELSFVLTKAIAKVCVHMTLQGIEYLSAVPNLHYY